MSRIRTIDFDQTPISYNIDFHRFPAGKEVMAAMNPLTTLDGSGETRHSPAPELSSLGEQLGLEIQEQIKKEIEATVNYYRKMTSDHPGHRFVDPYLAAISAVNTVIVEHPLSLIFRNFPKHNDPDPLSPASIKRNPISVSIFELQCAISNMQRRFGEPDKQPALNLHQKIMRALDASDGKLRESIENVNDRIEQAWVAVGQGIQTKSNFQLIAPVGLEYVSNRSFSLTGTNGWYPIAGKRATAFKISRPLTVTNQYGAQPPRSMFVEKEVLGITIRSGFSGDILTPDKHLTFAPYRPKPTHLGHAMHSESPNFCLKHLADAFLGCDALHQEGLCHSDFSLRQVRIVPDYQGGTKGLLTDFEFLQSLNESGTLTSQALFLKPDDTYKPRIFHPLGGTDFVNLCDSRSRRSYFNPDFASAALAIAQIYYGLEKGLNRLNYAADIDYLRNPSIEEKQRAFEDNLRKRLNEIPGPILEIIINLLYLDHSKRKPLSEHARTIYEYIKE